MPAMERLTLQDLREPGATLGAGVSAGFLAGVLIGGVGGRLAMLALRLTSDPSLNGVSTDDGFTIGRVSLQTLFLLGVTAGLGMAGGLFYLVVRRWIPSPLAHPTDDAVLRVGRGRRAHRPERCRLHAALAAAARGGAFRRDPRGLRRDDAVDRRTPAPRGLDPANGDAGPGSWAWCRSCSRTSWAPWSYWLRSASGPSVARHRASSMPGDPRSSRGSAVPRWWPSRSRPPRASSATGSTSSADQAALPSAHGSQEVPPTNRRLGTGESTAYRTGRGVHAIHERLDHDHVRSADHTAADLDG